MKLMKDQFKLLTDNQNLKGTTLATNLNIPNILIMQNNQELQLMIMTAQKIKIQKKRRQKKRKMNLEKKTKNPSIMIV
jgi:hypothetical protein